MNYQLKSLANYETPVSMVFNVLLGQIRLDNVTENETDVLDTAFGSTLHTAEEDTNYNICFQ